MPDALTGYSRRGPPVAPGFRRVKGVVAVRRVSTCVANVDLASIDLETGDGWAMDFGDAQFQGSIRVTAHDLDPGPGHADVTSVRLGVRTSAAPWPSGPFVFGGLGFAMDWVSSEEFSALQPLMSDGGDDAFPLGAYLEAGAGVLAGQVMLVAQFSASASLLYYQEEYVDYYEARSAGLTTWALSLGAGVTF